MSNSLLSRNGAMSSQYIQNVNLILLCLCKVSPLVKFSRSCGSFTREKMLLCVHLKIFEKNERNTQNLRRGNYNHLLCLHTCYNVLLLIMWYWMLRYGNWIGTRAPRPSLSTASRPSSPSIPMVPASEVNALVEQVILLLHTSVVSFYSLFVPCYC